MGRGERIQKLLHRTKMLRQSRQARQPIPGLLERSPRLQQCLTDRVVIGVLLLPVGDRVRVLPGGGNSLFQTRAIGSDLFVDNRRLARAWQVLDGTDVFHPLFERLVEQQRFVDHLPVVRGRRGLAMQHRHRLHGGHRRGATGLQKPAQNRPLLS